MMSLNNLRISRESFRDDGSLINGNVQRVATTVSRRRFRNERNDDFILVLLNVISGV